MFGGLYFGQLGFGMELLLAVPPTPVVDEEELKGGRRIYPDWDDDYKPKVYEELPQEMIDALWPPVAVPTLTVRPTSKSAVVGPALSRDEQYAVMALWAALEDDE